MQKQIKKVNILFLLPTLNIISPGRGVLTLASLLDRTRYTAIICSMRKSELEAKKKAEEQNIKVIDLNMRSIIDLSVIWKLKRILINEKIDILHNIGFRPEIYGGLAGRLAHCRAILATIVHNPAEDIILDYGFIVGTIMNFLRRVFAIFCEDALVAISKDAKRGLLSLHFPERKIRVIYSGINEESLKKESLDREQILKKFGIQPNNFIVGVISVLKPRKGLFTFINAVKMVAQDCPNVKILIIGKGPLKEKLDDQIKSLNLQNQIIFYDYVENIAETYKIFNLFVLPSLTEGFPAVLLEAMALKVPIIATKVGGVPEAIEDGISGILVPPQNSKALAEAIIKIYKDSNLSSKFVENAQIRFKKYFTAEMSARQYEKVYEELLKKSKCQ